MSTKPKNNQAKQDMYDGEFNEHFSLDDEEEPRCASSSSKKLLPVEKPSKCQQQSADFSSDGICRNGGAFLNGSSNRSGREKNGISTGPKKDSLLTDEIELDDGLGGSDSDENDLLPTIISSNSTATVSAGSSRKRRLLKRLFLSCCFPVTIVHHHPKH